MQRRSKGTDILIFCVADDIYAVKEQVPWRCKIIILTKWGIDLFTLLSILLDWIVYGGGNFITTCLNVWWFSQMISMLRKRFTTKETAKHK